MYTMSVPLVKEKKSLYLSMDQLKIIFWLSVAENVLIFSFFYLSTTFRISSKNDTIFTKASPKYWKINANSTWFEAFLNLCLAFELLFITKNCETFLKKLQNFDVHFCYYTVILPKIV